MRKGNVEGKARISLFQRITHSKYPEMPWEDIMTHFLGEKKISGKALEVPPQYDVTHEELRYLIFPFYPDTRKENAIKSIGSIVQSEGGCLWYLVCNSRLPKAHRNVSYHKAKIAGLKFSSVPKQLVSPFPSVAMDFPQNYIYGLTPRIKSENL